MKRKENDKLLVKNRKDFYNFLVLRDFNKKNCVCNGCVRARERASPANGWSNPIFAKVKRKSTASAMGWNF